MSDESYLPSMEIAFAQDILTLGEAMFQYPLAELRRLINDGKFYCYDDIGGFGIADTPQRRHANELLANHYRCMGGPDEDNYLTELDFCRGDPDALPYFSGFLRVDLPDCPLLTPHHCQEQATSAFGNSAELADDALARQTPPLLEQEPEWVQYSVRRGQALAREADLARRHRSRKDIAKQIAREIAACELTGSAGQQLLTSRGQFPNADYVSRHALLPYAVRSNRRI